MITEKDIKLLENELIKDDLNYVADLAKKLNMSRTTVYKFFACEKLMKSNITKIYDAALELLQEARLKEETRKKKVKKLIHGEGTQTSFNV